MIVLLTLLFIKHFVADFLYQPPFMYLNKGTYGHIGGILHSSFHAILTWTILAVLANFTSIDISLTAAGIMLVALGEFVVHYHVDWAKMKLNKVMKWGPSTHEEFWILLGLDQTLHNLTYIAIAVMSFL